MRLLLFGLTTCSAGASRRARVALTLAILLGVGGVAGAVGPAAAQPFIHGGGGVIDASDLNAALRAQGVPAVPEGYLTYGAGGHGHVGRFVIGGAGHTLRGFTRVENGSSTRLDGGAYGFVDVGYVVAEGDRWRLYPLASVGGGSVRVEVVQDVGRRFDDAIDAPPRRTRLEAGSFLVGASLVGEWRIPDWLAVVGVRAGYYAAPAAGTVHADGVALDAAPTLAPSGPYVRLSFGGGVGALIVGEVLGSLFS